MGRIRDPKRDQAFEIYKSSGGKIGLIDIANQLGVSDGTVRGWKAKDSWDSLLNGKQPKSNIVITDSKRSETNQKKERNAPKNGTERSNNKERSKKVTERDEPTFIVEVDNDELTDRQRLFCIYYVKSFNATMSAIKAGYSKEGAHVRGHELLRNSKVREEIKRLKSNIANELMIDAMDVLNTYAAIAFADLTDFVEFGQEDVPIFTKKGAPLLNLDGSQATARQTFFVFKNADEVDGTIISEVKEGKEISIKLHDKMKALEKLERYFDILPDHHKRRIQDARLQIEQERLELEKAKAAVKEGGDDELVDDWAGAVMDDGTDGEEVEA